MSSVSNGLYFLTLPLVSVMRVIYQKIRHARYLYIKRNVEKVWGARYTLGARYLSKNTVFGLQVYSRSPYCYGNTRLTEVVSYKKTNTRRSLMFRPYTQWSLSPTTFPLVNCTGLE